MLKRKLMRNFKSKRRFHSNYGSFGNSHNNNRKKFNNRRTSKKRGRSEDIDTRKFVCRARPEEQISVTKIQNSFSDFKFDQIINRNISEIGYSTPTPIQDQSIVSIMEGRDLIGLANTGTGKTAAFLLPLIDKCIKNRNQKVLIIAPTRELAQQIEQELKKFSKNLGIQSVVCVGGIPIYRQISNLKRNPNFVVGTPGRLKDLKNRANIRFGLFQNIVLDEIDRMLDMGFVDEIKQILEELPKKRQSLFFSATLPPKIESLVQQFLINPVTVKTTIGKTAQNVDQDVVRTTDKNKFNRLTELLSKDDLNKVLIFSETKRGVEKLSKSLSTNGFTSDSIHGDKKQNQRQRALLKFKDNAIQVLVATDVAARGLDIDNVSHVINYTIPQTYNDYIHRIGRTGRGDKKGVALTFVE